VEEYEKKIQKLETALEKVRNNEKMLLGRIMNKKAGKNYL
jgi:hypothetical protein